MPQPAVPPVTEPARSERSESVASKPAPQPGRSGNKAVIALVAASVVVLGVFAWWLTSRSSTPVADEPALPEPSAEASDAAMPEATPQPIAPVTEAPVPVLNAPPPEPAPEEIIESEPVAVPPTPSVDEAAQAQARRLKVEEEARQAQARREAQAQARQREQDKAKLNQANKTLDDLLK
ncbi:hypothetical protein [Aquabacterium sp.]|uniref:hypothetical protein n=1 Tax=Aquabacterium sp. TaxID=1872578 RepID=UPI002A35A624|nr:hypothetical protein [Aquabacterium sp.]